MARGVKKRLNFLGVMDGFRRSLAELRGGGDDGIGGILLLVFNDDELLTPKGVEVLLELSAMAKGFSSTTRAESWVQGAYATKRKTGCTRGRRRWMRATWQRWAADGKGRRGQKTGRDGRCMYNG